MAPLYFYSAWVLFASIVLFWFFWHKNTQKHLMELVGSPAVGDVYTIRQEKNKETSYYFFKIIGLAADSVFAIHNNIYYSDFVNHLAQDDYFIKDDTIVYRTKNLKEMLERDEIFSVSREYDEGDGFNRIR